MRVAGLVESVEHVCTRYRLRGYEALWQSQGISIDYFAIPQSPWARFALFRQLRQYDSVILLRKLFSSFDLRILRAYCKHLVFDLDDAVWLRDSYSPKGLQDARRKRRFENTCQTVDCVTAGNNFLLQQALKQARLGIVLPTCVHTESYRQVTEKHLTGAFTLAWIGSASTLQGIPNLAAVFQSFQKEVPEFRLRIIADSPLELPNVQTEFIRWSQQGELAALKSANAGFTWIPDDDWSRGKCGLKTLQYMASGLPVLANPVGVHPEMIIDGESGFLPKTDQEWLLALRRLYTDPILRRRLGTKAQTDCQNHYDYAQHAWKWWETVFPRLKQRRVA